MYQPGEQWLYNSSGQVLGVLLARACGKDLESVLRERIFEPLGMTDTGFTVRAGQLSRLATAYQPDPQTGELSVLDDPAHSWWSTPPSFPDASGWLVSTIDDYWSFVSMMLAGGTGQGERILSPATVARMTTDRLTSSQRDVSALFLGEHGGWGLGLMVPATGASEQPLPCGIWLGRRHWHHVALQPWQRRHRDPVHPASGHVAGAASRSRGLLGRHQRRHRDALTTTLSAIFAGRPDAARCAGSRSRRARHTVEG